MLTPAPLESARFGLRTFRATPEEVDTSRLFDALCAEHVDLAILRVRPGAAAAVRALSRRGLAPIHADTLVAYTCDLRGIDPPPAAPDGCTIETAQEHDRDAIGALVDTVFANYPGHYAANPLLAPADVVAGYREWALAHIKGEHRCTWIARADGRVAAIACSSFDPATGHCQGVLHGVHPDFARGGIYTALIRHTQAHFRKLGCTHLGIQTQAWNLPVQRVWVREGFVLADVFETFHVNALLDFSQHAVASAELQLAAGAGAEDAIRRAMLDLAGERTDGNSVSEVALFGAIGAGGTCTLRVRRRDFHAGHIVTAALSAPNGRVCALARSTRMNDRW